MVKAKGTFGLRRRRSSGGGSGFRHDGLMALLEVVYLVSWTTGVYVTEARALPSAVNGSVPCRPPPHPPQGWRLRQLEPERELHARVPALSMAYPSVYSSLFLGNALTITKEKS